MTRLFGDSARIQARNIARFWLGVAMLAAHEGEPGKIVNQTVSLGDTDLLPLFFDPVLRNAFEGELTRLENGVPAGHSFSDLLRRAQTGTRVSAGPAGQGSRPRRRSRHRPARAPRRPAHRPARLGGVPQHS